MLGKVVREGGAAIHVERKREGNRPFKLNQLQWPYGRGESRHGNGADNSGATVRPIQSMNTRSLTQTHREDNSKSKIQRQGQNRRTGDKVSRRNRGNLPKKKGGTITQFTPSEGEKGLLTPQRQQAPKKAGHQGLGKHCVLTENRSKGCPKSGKLVGHSSQAPNRL